MNSEDESSTASSPSSPLPIVLHKRKAGRKKFKVTRHPVYRGIRRRYGNKWVCEVRKPNKNSRIWLGTLPSPEMAAQPHDVAALALCGRNADLNFPIPPRSFPRTKSASTWDIRLASVHAARALPFPPLSCSSSTNFSSHESTCDAKAFVPFSRCTLTHTIVPRKSYIEVKPNSFSLNFSQDPLVQRISSPVLASQDSCIEIPTKSYTQCIETERHDFFRTENPCSRNTSIRNAVIQRLPSVKCQKNSVVEPIMVDSSNFESHKIGIERFSSDSTCVEGSNSVFSDPLVPVFVDEEELFNMPALLDSMAEGLLLTPPAMKTGFNWGDMDDGHHMDLLLW
ncbi:Dehydration-responsive element-binding protein like [Actinidia chinensis var. chinensis]|uniref:Dehydration-responsive element-binding protein like n=1 Tax=Actinidia chinensis var. chinensis TaxID=1590841 RepID=A0A2R6P7D3_ACTCC|nr:Dehydration-responsive element-binding protein like [Actinidia chinensis var. chinensis]